MEKILNTKKFNRVIGNESLTVTCKIKHLQGNQHPYFSITAELRIGGRLVSCGCMHETIGQFFPELQKIIPFHLCNNEGIPMYYFENSLYHLRKGNINGFKSCALYGVLESDYSTDPELLSHSYAQTWLENRLPALKNAYFAAMWKLFCN